MFNADSFLSQEISQANSTKSLPVPEGEYVAVIDSLKVRTWESKKNPGTSGVTLEVFWSIDDAEVKEFMGRQSVKVKQGVMLDVSESGQLETGKGKNVGLGRLRAAVGLNQEGKPFNLNQLTGQVAKVQVKHRLGEIPEDGSEAPIYDEVSAVASLG